MLLPKPTTTEDPEFIDWLKDLPCAGCGRTGYLDEHGVKQGIVPHHQNKKSHGKKGKKCDDRRAVPLCTPYFQGDKINIGCHAKYHKSPGTFWDRDVEELIAELNRIFDTYVRRKR